MSISAVSQPSSIWANATSALTSTPAANSLKSGKPNAAGTDAPQPTRTDTSRSNPFQQFSSDLQGTLIQAQAAQSKGSWG
jgi:hypothetical protein